MIRSNLTGKRFGRLLVIGLSDKRLRNRPSWESKCDCGNTVTIVTGDLNTLRIVSCGCYNKEILIKRNTKHNHTREGWVSRTYSSWANMKTRCTNQNIVQHKDYSDRGIRVCERWLIFENFLQDMGERPIGKTLDRIDNDGNYEPSNCRWASYREQRMNQRRMAV